MRRRPECRARLPAACLHNLRGCGAADACKVTREASRCRTCASAASFCAFMYSASAFTACSAMGDELSISLITSCGGNGVNGWGGQRMPQLETSRQQGSSVS